MLLAPFCHSFTQTLRHHLYAACSHHTPLPFSDTVFTISLTHVSLPACSLLSYSKIILSTLPSIISNTFIHLSPILSPSTPLRPPHLSPQPDTFASSALILDAINSLSQCIHLSLQISLTSHSPPISHSPPLRIIIAISHLHPHLFPLFPISLSPISHFSLPISSNYPHSLSPLSLPSLPSSPALPISQFFTPCSSNYPIPLKTHRLSPSLPSLSSPSLTSLPSRSIISISLTPSLVPLFSTPSTFSHLPSALSLPSPSLFPSLSPLSLPLSPILSFFSHLSLLSILSSLFPSLSTHLSPPPSHLSHPSHQLFPIPLTPLSHPSLSLFPSLSSLPISILSISSDYPILSPISHSLPSLILSHLIIIPLFISFPHLSPPAADPGRQLADGGDEPQEPGDVLRRDRADASLHLGDFDRQDYLNVNNFTEETYFQLRFPRRAAEGG
ncbi:hypothetical protein C7M84_022391 [Penaeus vannamei]|uniref:Uncharacterized protein n=1 Tax=Penaeus vannamei TaxID=6689 RepID=A0A3R7NDQ4_PENVA|nr:hypothetical protein C7M84_022391 [Penaeus vannamei]